MRDEVEPTASPELIFINYPVFKCLQWANPCQHQVEQAVGACQDDLHSLLTCMGVKPLKAVVGSLLAPASTIFNQRAGDLGTVVGSCKMQWCYPIVLGRLVGWLAPTSIRKRTLSECPFHAARTQGVIPISLAVTASTSAPQATAAWAQRVPLLHHASIHPHLPDSD